MSRCNDIDLLTLLVGFVKDPSQLEPVIITSISMDSRHVESGAVFIATAKQNAQRQRHIAQAISAGANVILLDADSNDEKQYVGVQVVTIKALQSKVSEIAARFYGHPSLGQTIIAITGTNGKTSVSQFIAQSLEFSGQPCGVIGTLGIGRIHDLCETGMTTPDPVKLQAILAGFFEQSIKTVVIEASSHALDQGRLNSVAIDVAVLTNLSRDHLDYHQTMARYADAKKRLFSFDSVKKAVLNADDELGQTLMREIVLNEAIQVVGYSQARDATLTANAIVMTTKGLQFTLKTDNFTAEIKTSLLGQFNVDNLLATAGSLIAIGMTLEQVVRCLHHCKAATGRMEMYGGEQQVSVVIDFAHTPDALCKALQSLQQHRSTQGQLWCVFGCGGDRDVGKRPLMGNVVEQNADQIIITADNPRSESNVDIVKAILSGFDKPNLAHVNHNRKQAINQAIRSAKKQDIVLVAGKGHEQYQDIAGVKNPCSDIETVIKALAAGNSGQSKLASTPQ